MPIGVIGNTVDSGSTIIGSNPVWAAPGRSGKVLALLLILLLLCVFGGVIGFTIHGLLWIAVIAIIVFLVAGFFGYRRL